MWGVFEMSENDTCVDGIERIGDREVISRENLEHTADTEHGPTYRCPRCGYEWVHEYFDCPECLWAGMCQEGWE